MKVDSPTQGIVPLVELAPPVDGVKDPLGLNIKPEQKISGVNIIPYIEIIIASP